MHFYLLGLRVLSIAETLVWYWEIRAGRKGRQPLGLISTRPETIFLGALARYAREFQLLSCDVLTLELVERDNYLSPLPLFHLFI